MALRAALAISLSCALAASACAGFLYEGYNPQTIREEIGVPNAALDVQAGGLYSSAAYGGNVYAPDFSFTLPAGDAVRYSRLLVSWWGGAASHTYDASVTVNGVLADQFTFGGVGDANPIYDPHATCVYGSGFGVWLTALDITSQVTLGALNTVQLDLQGDPFDGRCFHWQVVTAYDTPTAGLLSYRLLEGLGYMRGTAAGSVPGWILLDRWMDLGDFTLDGLTQADLWMTYTHGVRDRWDWADLNSAGLGGNDIADSSTPSPYIDPVLYPNRSYFDFEYFDITPLLAPSGNTLGVHTTTGAEGGQVSMNVGPVVVAAYRSGQQEVIPEPCSLAILAAGLGAAALARRRRRR